MNPDALLSLSLFQPLFAPPCEQTTWVIAGLMGWNVTGYVFIGLISSPARTRANKRVKERQSGWRGGGELGSRVIVWIHN